MHNSASSPHVVVACTAGMCPARWQAEPTKLSVWHSAWYTAVYHVLQCPNVYGRVYQAGSLFCNSFFSLGLGIVLWLRLMRPRLVCYLCIMDVTGHDTCSSWTCTTVHAQQPGVSGVSGAMKRLRCRPQQCQLHLYMGVVETSAFNAEV